MSEASTPEEIFAGYPLGLQLYRTTADAVMALGEVEERATKSQVAFRVRRGFAYVWRPGQYVKSDVPAVLSIALPRRLESPRVKSAVQVSNGLWMHHIELSTTDDIDDEVVAWLAEAFHGAS
jgi:hypothetical protein